MVLRVNFTGQQTGNGSHPNHKSIRPRSGMRKIIAVSTLIYPIAAFIFTFPSLAPTSGPGESRRSVISQQAAIKILGSRRFFSADQVVRQLNQILGRRGLPLMSPPEEDYIPYTEDTLRRHADGRWLLFWNPGLSLHELHEAFGTDPAQQPCFFGNTWWLGEGKEPWARLRSNTGYVLLNVDGMFYGSNWHKQQADINSLGAAYHRAS